MLPRATGLANVPQNVLMKEIVSLLGPKNALRLSLASKAFSGVAEKAIPFQGVNAALKTASQKVMGGLTWLVAKARAEKENSQRYIKAARMYKHFKDDPEIPPVPESFEFRLRKRVPIIGSVELRLVMGGMNVVSLRQKGHGQIHVSIIDTSQDRVLGAWVVDVKKVNGAYTLDTPRKRADLAVPKATKWLFYSILKGGVHAYNAHPVSVNLVSVHKARIPRNEKRQAQPWRPLLRYPRIPRL